MEVIIEWWLIKRLLIFFKYLKTFFIFISRNIYKFYKKCYMEWYITPKIKEMIIADLSDNQDYFFKESKWLLENKKCIVSEYKINDSSTNIGLNIIDINNTPKIIIYKLSVYITLKKFIEYKKTVNTRLNQATIKDVLEKIINNSFRSFISSIKENTVEKTNTKVEIICK